MTRQSNHRFIYLLLLCLAAMSACEPDVTYSQHHHIGAEGWDRADTLYFETDTLRHDGAYTFHLALRTTRRFPYQKVGILVERMVYRQKEEIFRKRERAICTIATEKGDYVGTGVGLLQYGCALRALQLQAGDSVSLRITHYMDTVVLPEVRDVGVLMARSTSL